MQDTLTEQIELGSAIPLPFDQFEPRDLPFDLPLAPRRGQPRLYRSLILRDPCDEGMQSGEREAFDLL